VKAAGEDEGTCQNNVQPPPPTGTTCETVCQKLMACDPSITQAQCDQTCAGFNDTCKTCIAGENCTALSSGTACMTECGAGPNPNPNPNPTPAEYEHLLDSCAALCQDNLTCATPIGGGDGICTKPCGTSFDCEDLDGLKGVDTWVCSDEVSGGQACVPFGWP